MRIGVLALQGAFIEHCEMLGRLGVESIQIRQPHDFSDNLDGLVIPGGESTVMVKLLHGLSLLEPVKAAVFGGMPTFGTCAGMILLSRQIEGNGPGEIPFLDVSVCRNAYGRQLGSFRVNADFQGVGEVEMIFIRAPYVSEVQGKAKALAVVDERIVAVEHNNVLATAFHPELSNDTHIHEYFLDQFCI